MKTNFQFSRVLLLALFALVSFQMSSQIISLSPPNPAFTSACAGKEFGSGPFNSYDVTINWGGSPSADNEFILELSDANGDFTNLTELARITDQNNNTSKTFDINFAIPTDTAGDGYKFKIRSTNPTDEEESTTTHSIYYMDFTQTSLTITELRDGVPPGSVCNPMILGVDNGPDPLNYKYNWFRSGTLLSEKSHELTNITQGGNYFVQIDYGGCSDFGETNSNIVEVTVGGSGPGVGIASPSRTALCAGESETLSVDTIDSSADYRWFKDGAPIPGAIATSFVVNGSTNNFEGGYQVEISGSGICTQLSPAITMTNAGAFTITRNNEENLVVLPSQPETLSVSTTATTPTYQWYRNGTMLAGATNAALDINQDGTYYVAVTSSGACASTITSENTVAVVPTSFEIIIDYDFPHTACVSTSTVIEVAMINAIALDGTKTDVTGQLETAFTYQWQLNGTNVSGATNEAISLTNPSENGDYTVNAALGSYNETSNILPLQLLTSETVAITSTSAVYCNSSDAITISTTTDLTGETFSWERDGTSMNSTDPTLSVTEPGAYTLVIDKDGCPLNSNEIAIIPLDPNLITLDVDGDIVFPEGASKTVTASGGSAYQWFDEGNNIIGSTDQLSFTEEGTYSLIATIDNCQITRQLTVVYQDLFNVPNVITPNGDGSNDQWILPNTYSNKSDVTVTIYNDKGVELVNETSYANNWPQSSMSFPQQNMVFYYTIKNAAETLKQGTITVIR